MTEMIGSAGQPPVQIAMGEIAALVSIYEGCCSRTRPDAPIKDGVLWPSVITLYAAMAMQSEFNGRMLEIVRELVSSSVISQPSSAADFDNPETAPISSATCARARWTPRAAHGADAAALGFPRHRSSAAATQQYEKFYGGSSFVVKQNVYRTFDWKRAGALVDAALALPPVE